jgi:hypothetical protein
MDKARTKKNGDVERGEVENETRKLVGNTFTYLIPAKAGIHFALYRFRLPAVGRAAKLRRKKNGDVQRWRCGGKYLNFSISQFSNLGK